VAEGNGQDAPATEPGDAALSALASEWLGAVGGRLRGCTDLVLAETRLALSTFLLMIFLTVLAAGAALFAWVFLVIALAQVPLGYGLSPAATALILLGLHLLLALILWRIANGMGRNMEFRATRRLLSTPAEPTRTPGGDEP
jgi:uncharacterized membrane protein YqjE